MWSIDSKAFSNFFIVGVGPLILLESSERGEGSIVTLRERSSNMPLSEEESEVPYGSNMSYVSKFGSACPFYSISLIFLTSFYDNSVVKCSLTFKRALFTKTEIWSETT